MSVWRRGMLELLGRQCVTKQISTMNESCFRNNVYKVYNNINIVHKQLGSTMEMRFLDSKLFRIRQTRPREISRLNDFTKNLFEMTPRRFRTFNLHSSPC